MLHIKGIVGQTKQCWRYLIDADVGALGAEQYGD